MTADVYISNASVVCPIGNSLLELEIAMKSNVSGISKLEGIVPKDFPIQYGGLIKLNSMPKRADNRYAEEVEIILRHLLYNLVDSDPSQLENLDAIICASNDGYPHFFDIVNFYDKGILPNYLSGHFITSRISSILSEMGFTPPACPKQITVVNGCITGLSAIGRAFRQVSLGISKKVLIVGYERLIRYEDILRYDSIGALIKETCKPEKASRPFSKNRAGFVKGEGAGALIVSSLPGKQFIFNSKICSYAQTSDAYRLTEPSEEGDGMLKCYEQLFSKIKIKPTEIDYINAHGTGTIKNDFVETKFIKRFFSDRANSIPISSLKSQIGHLNYACGIVETIASIIMLKKEFLAPTLNFEQDPILDLDFVGNFSSSHRMNYMIKNSFGFGGGNASLLLERCDL